MTAPTGPLPKQPLPHPPLGREFNEWILTGFTYDVGTIYSSATNSKDHSETLSFKVPPLINSIVKQFMEEYRDLGYRSASDFLRDAIFHRIYQVCHMMDDLQGPVWPKVQELVVLAQIEHDEMMEGEGQRLIAKTWERVEKFVAEGWTGDAEDAIDTLHDVVTGYPKSDRREAAMREIADMRKFLDAPTSRRNVTRLGGRRGA